MQWRKIKAFAENPDLYSVGSVQLECRGFEQGLYHPCEISISNCQSLLVKVETSSRGARKAPPEADLREKPELSERSWIAQKSE